jgi:hypothetical protein
MLVFPQLRERERGQEREKGQLFMSRGLTRNE